MLEIFGIHNFLRGLVFCVNMAPIFLSSNAAKTPKIYSNLYFRKKGMRNVARKQAIDKFTGTRKSHQKACSEHIRREEFGQLFSFIRVSNFMNFLDRRSIGGQHIRLKHFSW